MENKFYKLSGCGNDFIFIDDKTAEKIKLSKSKIIKLCARKTGIGADGVAVYKLKPTPSWKFYNNDGSRAELCGNAARCFIFMLSEIFKYPENKLFFKSDAGKVVGHKKQNKFFIEVEKPKTINHKINKEKNKFLVDSGVPHLVIFGEDLSKLDKIAQLGEKYFKKGVVLKEGVNVTFIDKKFNAITFERGVDYFTLACGTGALASAFAVKEKFEKDKFKFKFPGGDLNVEIGEKYLLGGKVDFVFQGDIKLF